ncbi:MAG: SPOR domain-containing protein [Prevotellaceae bacterium]|jgi:hypothetical protein|nr:SPOR domain-containing protein [Prevotellaceae bacterium]
MPLYIHSITLLLILCLATAVEGVAQTGDTTIFATVQAGGKVAIVQSRAIEEAVRASIERRQYEKPRGFRIRLFFDNDQRARQKSLAIATAFATDNPDVAVYHDFEDLYFRVTAGDFRTRSEAMRLLEKIRKNYPSAFIIACPVNLLETQRERERVFITSDEPETD